MTDDDEGLGEEESKWWKGKKREECSGRWPVLPWLLRWRRGWRHSSSYATVATSGYDNVVEGCPVESSGFRSRGRGICDSVRRYGLANAAPGGQRW